MEQTLHVYTKPMRTDTAGRSVTFTTHRATLWEPCPGWAVPCHTISFSSGMQHPNEGQVQLPSIHNKNVNLPFVEKASRTKAPLTAVLLLHFICWGFKILIPDGAFLALEERLQKCLFMCLIRQLLIIIRRQYLSQHLLVHNEQN